MRSVLSAFLLVSVSYGLPYEHGPYVSSDVYGQLYKYALDVWVPVPKYQIANLRGLDFRILVIRIYAPGKDSTGIVDPDGLGTVKSLQEYNKEHPDNKMGIELYVQPPISSTTKTGAKILQETYDGLYGNSIVLKAIWLKVFDPSQWSTDPSTNVAFIDSFLAAAKDKGLRVGLFSLLDDWNQITGGTQQFKDIQLWYLNVRANGEAGESEPNFSDFSPFGGWVQPKFKTYGRMEYRAGVYCNLLVYS